MNSMNIGLKGHFTINHLAKDGQVKQVYDFENLITDSGLSEIAIKRDVRGQLLVLCQVGTSNEQPRNENTSLIAPIGRKFEHWTNDFIWSNQSTDEQNIYHFTKKFRITGVVGNIAEVGIFTKSESSLTESRLFSRALVKDAQGRTTVISLLAGEVLDVSYTLIVNLPNQDKTGVINISGEPYNYTARIARLGQQKLAVSSEKLTGLYRGELGNKQSEPTYPIGSLYGNQMKPEPLASAIKYNITAGLDDGNHADGVRSIAFFSVFNSCWQIQYSKVSDGSTIPKTNKYTLILPVQISWGRA